MELLNSSICSILIASFLLIVTGEMSDEECTANGFNRQTLKCSSCDLLENFNLNEITDSCQQCCVEDTMSPDVGIKKYPKARLEVCTCKFPALPQIEAFVKGDGAKMFPNLVVKHVNGLSPIIKLIDDDGNVDQTLAISKWDTNTIIEFLSTYLVKY